MMRITKAYVLVCAVVALLAVLTSQAAEKTPFTATGGSETILFPGSLPARDLQITQIHFPALTK